MLQNSLFGCYLPPVEGLRTQGIVALSLKFSLVSEHRYQQLVFRAKVFSLWLHRHHHTTCLLSSITSCDLSSPPPSQQQYIYLLNWITSAKLDSSKLCRHDSSIIYGNISPWCCEASVSCCCLTILLLLQFHLSIIAVQGDNNLCFWDRIQPEMTSCWFSGLSTALSRSTFWPFIVICHQIKACYSLDDIKFHFFFHRTASIWCY